MYKTCAECNKRMPLEKFHKYNASRDGHKSKCKECRKAYERKLRRDHSEHYRKRGRERGALPYVKKARSIAEKIRRQTPEYKKMISAYRKEWNKRNYIKRSAHQAVQYAIKNGNLVKKACEICGKKKVEAHHDDYNKPLQVRFLCRKHHLEFHKQENDKKYA